MNGLTRSWRRPGLLTAAAVAGAAAVGLSAVPASAHTPNWSVTCSEVTVDLRAYNPRVTNTVSITVDGKDLLAKKTFGSAFHQTLTLPEHSGEVSVHLVVEAGDGDQYSRDETKTAPACESKPPASPTPSTPEKPSPTPSAPEKPTPSEPETAAPVPSSEPSSSDLAETGSSSATPIIAGVAGAVVVAGGGLVLATRRRRAAARH